MYTAVAAVRGRGASRLILPIGIGYGCLLSGCGSLFLQICDLLWDMNGAFYVQYLGTAVVRIYRRKQDTKRRKNYLGLGRTSQIEWDLVRG